MRVNTNITVAESDPQNTLKQRLNPHLADNDFQKAKEYADVGDAHAETDAHPAPSMLLFPPERV